MPLPSYARVTNLSNDRSIVVRVNDRGPFIRGRILDVSARVAKLLDFSGRGLVKVRLDYIGKAPPAGADEPALLASLQTGRGGRRPRARRPMTARASSSASSSARRRLNPDRLTANWSPTPSRNRPRARRSLRA